MACCGQRRALATGPGKLADKGRPAPRAQVVIYEYRGASAMTVTGPISGRSYRFAQPGARLQIDPRDAASLTGLPNLRRAL